MAPLQRATKTLMDRFLGRTFEVQRVAAVIDACLAGSPQLLVVEGEPGIGKTRFARRIAEIGIDRGVHAFSGSFFDDESELTFSGWIEVLRHLLDVLPKEFHPDEHDRRYLELLLPGLFRRVDEFDPLWQEAPNANDRNISRFLMFQAVSRLLSNAASWKPILIRLEDIHWADPSSIELLRHVGRTLSQSSVIILTTVRNTHVGAKEFVRNLTVDLAGDEGLERIKLLSLEENHARQLVKQTSAVRLSTPDLNEIVMRTGGNPFYIVEMTKWWNSVPRAAEKMGIPGTITDSIQHRLLDVSVQARSLLKTMSVIGNSVDPDLILILEPELDRGNLDELLSECISAGFVEVTEHNHIDYRHWLIRDAIYRSLPTMDARSEHSRVASAMKSWSGSDLAAVGHHLDRSMNHELRRDAGRIFLEVGLKAIAAMAWETAAVSFRRALTISTELGDDSLRPDLLRGLGRSLLPLDPADAYPHLVEAFDIYLERGSEADALDVALINARPLIGQDVGERVLRERGLRVAPEGSTSAGILRSRIGLVAALAEADFELAEVHIGAAETIAKKLDDDRVRLFADSARSMLLYVTFQLEEASNKAYDALRLATRQGDLLTEGSLLLFHGDLAMWLHNPDGLRLAGERMQVIGRRIGEPRIQAFGESHSITFEMLQGKFDSAKARRSDALDTFSFAHRMADAQTAVEKNDPEGSLRAVESLVAFVDGSLPQARAHVATALSVYEMMNGAPKWAPEIRMLVAGIEPRQGQLRAAHEWANGARLILAVAEEDAVTAESLIPSLEELSDIVIEWGPVRRFLAAAKALTGDTSGMRQDYQAAIEISRRLGLQPIHAWACYEYAKALSKMETPGAYSANIDKLLRESNRTSRKLGMRLLESRIRSLRGSFDGGPAGNLGELTPRERQVLEMVAGGHTNKEISFALGASLNTIYRHTNSIFTKLGVSNRTEAALTYRQHLDS